MAGYLGSTPVPQATQHRESFTATSGQTTFATAGYTAGFVDVYLNGSHLSPADFTATNGSDVVLASGASADDVCDIISHSAFELNAQTFTGTTTMDVVTATGVVTANAGVVVDNITIEGQEIDVSSGDFLLDVAGDIHLDADGDNIKLFFSGAQYLDIYKTGDNIALFQPISDGKILFQGNDGGQVVAAFTLDMQNAGAATFNAGITTTGVSLMKCATNDNIRISQQTHASIQAINDAANAFTELKLDGSSLLLNSQSGGNIFFGATSASAPSYYFAPDSGGGSFLSIKDSTNARTAFQFHNPNGTIGSITTSGSATAYNTSSDYRLKTNAQPMTGASDRVLALNPVNFKWIADGTRVDGFLAHEAQAVVPECVTGTKDAMKDEEYQVSAATGDIYTAGSDAGFTEISAAIEASPAYYDVDGNIIKAEVIAKAAVHEAYDAVDEVIHSTNAEQPETLADGQQWRETTPAVMGTRSVPDMQGIDQSKMVPLLVAALQEALARITVLENA